MTGMGMRQRFLLGKYMALKYRKLLNKNKTLMESVFHYRTLQSSYSEIIGLFESELEPKNISIS